MTYREITSKVINLLKLNTRDGHVSRRFILRLLQDSAQFLLAQKLGERSIINETNLFTYIPCFSFEKIDARKCNIIEFKMCTVLMKSKKPLPKLVFSRLGSSIREINSLDGDFRFTFIDENTYRRNKKRRYSLKNEVYIYLGTDNHLYIMEEPIQTVDLTVLTTRREDVEKTSDCIEKSRCTSLWETEFVCSDKLLDAVVNMTIQKMSINRQIIEDQNPNNIEGA